MTSGIDIRQFSKLAHLALSEEEEQAFHRSLTEILDAFEQLKTVDTEGVEPLYNINEENNTLRNDTPARVLSREELLRSAPRVSDASYRLRRVVSKD